MEYILMSNLKCNIWEFNRLFITVIFIFTRKRSLKNLGNVGGNKIKGKIEMFESDILKSSSYRISKIDFNHDLDNRHILN